jgi:hypothetical protein
VQSLLARAEKKAQDAGLAVLQASPYRRAWTEQARVYWDDEVTRLRAELDALLAGQAGLRAVNEDAAS